MKGPCETALNSLTNLPISPMAQNFHLGYRCQLMVSPGMQRRMSRQPGLVDPYAVVLLDVTNPSTETEMRSVKMTRIMSRIASLLLAGTVYAALSASQAHAQDAEILTINATVSTRAELVLSPTTVNFPDANPTTTPSIPADSTVSVTANVRTAGTPTLTVLANGDLISGADSIAIANVTWTASGAPFIAGTMNSITAQGAATLSAGSGQYAGTYSYFLANSWTYAVGAYTQTATYTLTAP